MKRTNQNMSAQKALERAMKICSREEKCSFDIRQKLFQWKVPPAEHDKVLKTLISQNFICNDRFVRYYVRDKFRFNKWGRQKIRYMLKQKQINESLISEALASEIDEENYHHTLIEIITQKQRQLKDDDPLKTKAKLIRFATSRGFESGKVFEEVNNIMM